MKRKNLTPLDASIIDDDKQQFGLPDIGIPAEVLFNPELTHTQKILFGFIRNLARSEKGCWATNRYLARCLGLEKQSVTNGVSKLKDLLYITVEFKTMTSGVQGRVIRVNDLYPHIYSEYIKQVYKNLSTGVVANLYPPIKDFLESYKKTAAKVVSKGDSKKDSNNIMFFPSSSNGNGVHKKEGVTPSDFEVFWKLYPSHRRGSKGKAITAWEKICKHSFKYRPTLVQIKEAVTSQKESGQWKKDIIPLATTWLNNKRWLDDAAQLKYYNYDKRKEEDEDEDTSSSNGSWMSHVRG